MVLDEFAKTRTGQVPPEEPGGEETDVEDSENGDEIAGRAATLHPESFTESSSAVHGATHLAVNGPSPLDNLLDHPLIHGVL